MACCTQSIHGVTHDSRLFHCVCVCVFVCVRVCVCVLACVCRWTSLKVKWSPFIQVPRKRSWTEMYVLYDVPWHVTGRDATLVCLLGLLCEACVCFIVAFAFFLCSGRTEWRSCRGGLTGTSSMSANWRYVCVRGRRLCDRRPVQGHTFGGCVMCH